MDILQALVLGIVQGLTEFAPVSSSAHLVLVPWLFGWNQPSLAFDTTLHLGTLVAVVAVFWRDLLELIAAWLRSFTSAGRSDPKATMAWAVLIGTIPAAVIGYLLKSVFEELFSLPLLVGVFLLVTAIAMLGSEFVANRINARQSIGILGGLLVGIAQVFAIAPGISRSGATMSAGRALGLSREEAARFSFLLSIPIILGAGASQIREMTHSSVQLGGLPVAVGFVAAAVSGYLCINLLLSFLRRRSLRVFSAYCVIIGVAAIALSIARGG
ncbi:MAG: undecaprenyl-diphosphatase UppP [Chloroflexi bacterium]|nr:undecaprenyl-diphosphatase UppP [Chloroflexota bacterium]